LGGSPLDDGLFSVSSESYKNFGKEADIEGAVERGLSKARISVSTRYSALDGVEGSNHQNVKFTSKMAGN
jgi:hypothetical protein